MLAARLQGSRVVFFQPPRHRLDHILTLEVQLEVLPRWGRRDASMKASNARSEVVCGGCAWTTADWLVDQIRSVSMAVMLSSCSAASNSLLEQTEWAQRCLLDTSLAGFGLTEPDRGDRVSSPTTRAAMD